MAGEETASPAPGQPSDVSEGGDADWVAQMGQAAADETARAEADSRARCFAQQEEAAACLLGAAQRKALQALRSEAEEGSSGPQQPPLGLAQPVLSFCLSTRCFAPKQAASVVCAWSPSSELYQECPYIPEPAPQLTADRQGTSLHLLLKTGAPIRRVPAPTVLHAAFRSGPGALSPGAF